MFYCIQHIYNIKLYWKQKITHMRYLMIRQNNILFKLSKMLCFTPSAIKTREWNHESILTPGSHLRARSAKTKKVISGAHVFPSNTFLEWLEHWAVAAVVTALISSSCIFFKMALLNQFLHIAHHNLKSVWFVTQEMSFKKKLVST